ncbi:hypothetical protein [Kitasatospora sp. MAP5-34]|uniref:hypothetical protein n=1 Tax=Kitasatospora sp. MAP5-34 TaxID=3035102 RepID=UPI0024747B59|nr:hypothetical protein [Kitasatospora sp. MAP5-34]MDH6579061.1 DNA-binding NarL/FixJ family response regulator [Kitasatospora sp. MAP5-34]
MKKRDNEDSPGGGVELRPTPPVHPADPSEDSVDVQPSEVDNGLHAIAAALADLSQRVAEEARRTVRDQSEEVPDSTPQAPGDTQYFAAIQGLTQINEAIQEALDHAQHEILTAQPDGPRPQLVLDNALSAVRTRIAAGVRMRTLYQHSTRFDEATKRYVREVANYGVLIRTLPEFFDRLIIVDRLVVFIPATSDRTTAIRIEEPAVVRFLADIFERAWDRAEPYPFLPVRAAEAAPEVIPALRDTIRRLLIEGRSDKEIARRLGISLRSLQAHVAHLKDEYQAQHRLQLGYLMGMEEALQEQE